MNAGGCKALPGVLVRAQRINYGMADNRIGVARLDVPESMPSGALADPVLGLSQGVGSDRLQAYTESVGGYMLPPTLARPRPNAATGLGMLEARGLGPITLHFPAGY